MEHEFKAYIAEEDKPAYYNLEQRTFEFARDIRLFINQFDIKY